MWQGLRLLALFGLLSPLAHASDATLESRLLELTNEARQRAGLAALEFDDTLARSARDHAAEMAELTYFAHDSPRPENATVVERAANAGSFAKTLGENLALVSANDPATRSVTGWLTSPGHRANLLSASFTHVGFGTAHYPDGRIVVAQTLALEPAVLVSATLSPSEPRPHLEVVLELDEPAEVALFFSGTASQPALLGPGTQRLRIPLSHEPTLPLDLQIGLRTPGSRSAFTPQASGTLGLEGWSGTAASGTRLNVLALQLAYSAQDTYVVQLTFAEPPRLALTAWQSGTRLPVEQRGDTLSLRLRDSGQGTPFHLGVAQGDGRYRVLYSFLPHFSGGATLLPVRD